MEAHLPLFMRSHRINLALIAGLELSTLINVSVIVRISHHANVRNLKYGLDIPNANVDANTLYLVLMGTISMREFADANASQENAHLINFGTLNSVNVFVKNSHKTVLIHMYGIKKNASAIVFRMFNVNQLIIIGMKISADVSVSQKIRSNVLEILILTLIGADVSVNSSNSVEMGIIGMKTNADVFAKNNSVLKDSIGTPITVSACAQKDHA